MVTTCPGLRKVNLVVHYKMPMLDDTHGYVWEPLLRLKHLVTRHVTLRSIIDGELPDYNLLFSRSSWTW